MKLIQEFKEFALKGNVVDMAVGVIIGGAFGKIVTSFVNDILMPPIGLLLGGKDFSELSVMLKPAVEATETTPAVEVGRVRSDVHRLCDHRILHLHVRQAHQLAQPQTCQGRDGGARTGTRSGAYGRGEAADGDTRSVEGEAIGRLHDADARTTDCGQARLARNFFSASVIYARPCGI